MKTYVVVAAVRISDWLARTPKLSLLRGASKALTEYTTSHRVKTHHGLQMSGEAGDVAGVIAVELPSGVQPELLADRMAARLRKDLPAIELEAWWQQADSYAEAIVENAAHRLTGVPTNTDKHGHKIYLPPLLDVPLAQTCFGCRQESATAERQFPEGRVRIGPDCLARYRVAYVKSEKSGTLDTSETDEGRPGERPRTFRELARLGGLSGNERDTSARSDVRNHLATVYADGNGLGNLMNTIAKASASPEAQILRKGIVGIIEQSTREACKRAEAKVMRPDLQRLPSIQHLVGGDDILISVPAPLAWEFVVALMEAFQSQITRGVDNLKLTDSALGTLAKNLSLGVGMTFAHESHPFEDARSNAYAVMRAAKKAVRGAEAAVSWVDLTAEDRLPPGRHVTLDQLRSDLDHGIPLAGLAPAARSVLAGKFRDGPTDGEGSPSPKLRPDLVKWAVRTKNAEVETLAKDDLATLRDVLSRLRWWPLDKASPVSVEGTAR